MRTARIISVAVLVFGALLLLTAGCVERDVVNKHGMGLTVYEDSTRSVVCYSRAHESLACVKVTP